MKFVAPWGDFSTAVSHPWQICGKSNWNSGKPIHDLQKMSKKATLNGDMPKRTFQPHKRHRAKTHGFRARVSTKAGRAVLKRRRLKGRAKIAI